jgi:hypothetical protein
VFLNSPCYEIALKKVDKKIKIKIKIKQEQVTPLFFLALQQVHVVCRFREA